MSHQSLLVGKEYERRLALRESLAFTDEPVRAG